MFALLSIATSLPVWAFLLLSAPQAEARTNADTAAPSGDGFIFLALASPAGLPPAEPGYLQVRHAQAPVHRAARPQPLTAPQPRTAKGERVRREMPLVVKVPLPSPAYLRTFRHLLENPRFTDRFDEHILVQARRFGLDARLLKSIIAAESEFDPGARSPKGAEGLMQMMPATAQEMGLPRNNLAEPQPNIVAGSAYIHLLYRSAWKKFGLKGVRYVDAPPWVVQRIIAAYHAGPRALNGASWKPSTRSYVRNVMLFYNSDVTTFRRSDAQASAFPSLSPDPSAASLQ